MSTTKKVFVALKMAGIAGQSKLVGVFRYLKETYGDSSPWEVQIVRTGAELTDVAVRRALADGTDGFIVSIPDTEDAVSPLKDVSTPTVAMDIYSQELKARKSNIVFIRNSSEDIGREAALFLLGQGVARSYAFLHSEPVMDWSEARFKAFKRVLNDNGIWCEELFSAEDAAKLKRPAAVLAANDDRAYELLKALAARRVAVPRGVAVLGVDNDELFCENTHPRLSSVQPDFEEEGWLAAKTLDDMMRGCVSTERTLLVGLKRVVQRESTTEQSNAGRLVQKAVAYIDRHALDGIAVNDVVRHLKCSRRLADMRFRELQGRTILDAITERRLDEVKGRLAGTKEKMDAIAAACGFKNPTYLKNLFSKRFGITMSEFRNSARGKTSLFGMTRASRGAGKRCGREPGIKVKAMSFAVALLAAASAFAAHLRTSAEMWDANPVAWTFRDDSAECFSLGGFAVCTNASRAARVETTATLTPVSAGTNGWATLGVALFDDERNYWHLAMVQAPPSADGKPGNHFFELCESRNGLWLSQSADRLKMERSEQHGSWSYGRSYAFALSTDGKGIQGEVRDSAGRLVFARRFAFPAPSADGSVAAVLCGLPALHANGGFRGRFAAIEASWDDLRPRGGKSTFPPYASDSFVTGISGKATGFFRVAQRPDGRWWVIDPLGRGMVPTGVDHVRYGGHWSQRTGRSVHYEVNKRKFPSVRDWESDALRRLKAWGFNLLGAGCDPALERRGLAHTRFLSMGNSLCKEWVDESFWICPDEHCPCSAFPNVFDPIFPAYCDYVARRRCAPNKDDPWLFGYFIDNELAWWGRGARDTGLFDAVMKKPETHSAKVALRAFLAERGVSGAPSAKDKLDFLRLAAERYFGAASAAIRRHDPNHLVMGARFAGIGGAHDVVWEVAGKYCDLVTFNIYPWADIDRNVVLVDGRLVSNAFAERYAIVKRPMLVTEWSFPALDSGLPCTGGAGQRFRTQRERTAATELFAKTMLATPSILGYDYFMWVDQPEEGISDAFPEDSNYGLINLQGEAYPEITSMFSALHGDIGRWRRAPLPAERPVTPSGLTAGEFAATLPAPSAPGGVTFARDGDGYALATRAGLALSGRIGGGSVFSQVALNGTVLGSCNAMVCYRDGGLRWRDISKVANVEFSEKKGWGMLKVTGQFFGDGGRHSFAVDLKIAVHPDMPYFIADIAKVANTGTVPLDVKALYVRQYAPYAKDKMRDKRKRVPNLWKAPTCDVWVRESDGVWWGGVTKSPACSGFRYFLTGDGRNQHPDAMFDLHGEAPDGSPDGLWRLEPGAAYEPRGTAWVLCIGGTGGREGWSRQIDGLGKNNREGEDQ